MRSETIKTDVISLKFYRPTTSDALVIGFSFRYSYSYS